MDDIRLALKERILVLDGAMGTVLQSRGLQGNSELFNLTSPGVVEDIHSEYIKAGSDIISTNSFGANKISQAELGFADKAADMAETAARIARKAADKACRKVWVAGSVGPTGKSLTLPQNIEDPVFRPYSFDDMADAFEEQIRGLVSGGVDLLLIETCFDALNTKAALYAYSRLFPNGDGPEIMISVSLGDKSGRTLTGQTPEAFYRSIEHCFPLSFGLNCSLGSREMVPLIADVSRFVEGAVSCYPNAGLPDAMGAYDETPEVTASAIREMALQGSVNIVGGCCGTTPAHIAAIAAAIEGLPPRAFSASEAIGGPAHALFVSGLESVEIDRRNNFTNVGERTNVAGSRKFAKLIAAGDYTEALRVAAGQIENGATGIDINMDDAMLDSRREMEKFLRHIAGEPEVAKAAIMIDSSHWDTLVTGLKNAQGKCIVNSISLKEGEEVFLRKAREIKALGAAIIVIAFDEEGQATTFDRKVEICQRAYALLTEKAGYSPTDIIFDVNVLPVGTGIPEHARYRADFIEAVRWIKRNLPGCRTSGGISNLSFAFRGNNTVREAMHSVFLYHAIKAGLDMGIVNPGMLKIYDEIEPELLRRVEDVILDSDPGATERLIDFAQRLLAPDGGSIGGPTASLRSAPPLASQSEAPVPPLTVPRVAWGGPTYTPSVEERLERALVKGDSANLEEDIKECLEKYGEAYKVIDGPLMDGMARVGELFGAGKMFLPQVVKSARTMKASVEILQPYLEKERSDVSDRPKALFATVKGDVHDIGKNITGIVFTCNGFEVTDLGVMVPKETILEKAREKKVDIIGVSGLITPSLYQMELLCKDMEAQGLDTPLLVGGAAASAVHTAVKLAPLYKHVFYGSDASASAVLASKRVSDREATEATEHEKQRVLREAYEASKREMAAEPSAEASTAFPPQSYVIGNPFRNIPSERLEVSRIEEFFDWGLFFTILGVKNNGDHLEKKKLMAEARDVIERMKADGECRIMLSTRFDSAHSEGDDIVATGYRMPMFRQPGGLSLADFVAPVEYGFESPVGMFAISVHDSTASPDESVRRAVTLTLAEAASEWLDKHVSSFLPEGSKAKVIKPAAGYSSCPDHTLKRDILRLLPDSEKLGITLLDSCAMIPEACICGLIFVHENATYPEIRHLDKAAIDGYAARKGMSEQDKSRFLGHLL